MAAFGVRVGVKSFNGTALQQRPVPQTRVNTALTPIRAAQSLQGTVVTRIDDKTAIVAVDTLKIDPVYAKRVNSTKKYVAHVDETSCNVGDVVRLAPSRPLSKTKRFIVDEVVKQAV